MLLIHDISFPFQASQSALPSQHPGPVPDSVFISSNRPMARPVPLTTATKEGKAAANKRKAPKKATNAPAKKQELVKKKA